MRAALLLILGLLLIAGTASAAPYFNSSEPGCNGSDPNVLFCDDFETKADGSKPGDWYSLNGDQANAAGGVGTKSKGWNGTIFANPITPAGAVDCSPGVTPFGACAATSGPLNGGTGGRNMADHGFAGGGEVQDLWVRWYYKPSAGMQFSGQKVLSVNRACGVGGGCGGIFWLGLGYNIGTGSRNPVPDIGVTMGSGNPVGSKICDPTTSGNKEICRPNIGARQMAVPGNWNFYELHIKLNTPGARDGVVEMYVNDCGPTGASCTGTPTLRMRHTQADFGKTATNGGIGTLWFENWANNGMSQGSLGQEWYDQIKVSKAGPIGYAGASGTVPPPTVTYTLTATAQGAGTVSGSGSYPSGTAVTPVALAASGSTFSGWSGDCTGSGACTVTMTANKTVTATFTTPTTPPPTTNVPPAPSSPTVTLGTTDPSGVTFNVAWPAVATATSYSYTAGLSDNSSNLQGTVTPPNLLLQTPYMANGAEGSGFVCIKSVNAAGASAEAACNSLAIPAKPAVVPPQLTTGTLAVDAQISRCTYFLVAEPPDATGGWVAQFYYDGAKKVGNPVSAAPYKRTVELFAPSHSFSVQFTKSGQVSRSPAVVTRACP